VPDAAPMWAGMDHEPWTLVLRDIRLAGSMFRSAVPVLPSTDVDRTAAFYLAAGFRVSERSTDYLVLCSGDVELQFSPRDTIEPGECFLHVADAMKLWQQLCDQNVAGVGPIDGQAPGFREFVLTDPDGNRIGIGSPFVV
jgi:catechol 2,3-dioxygenase-like lactoylglutathione lyase family enzyme